MEIHWIEAKQLDRVTNFSSRVEIIKRANELGIPFFYYCTFKGQKKDFKLPNIKYLGSFNNKIIRAIEFKLLVILKCIELVIKNNDCVIMTNQDLVKNALLARFINKVLGKKNKFVVDIRTTPTNPESFDKDMIEYHSKFKWAVKYYDGLSFITPFMEKYSMRNYKSNKPIVHWSSGVDQKLFDYSKYRSERTDHSFKIFYHGGISISRGNLELIKACEILKNEGYDINLTQIGICVDTQLSEYISSENIGQWCKLLPPVALDEIPQLIANCDLPVLPFPDFMAWRVSSPIKLMEYLSMGKKVLAPKMEAFTDVFGENSDIVYYFNSKTNNQAEEMANRIKEIIIADELKNLDKKKLFDFVEKYSWSNQADNLLNFCKNL